MIVSLDDQLEWQESSRSHSPRTPTAPEALKNLRRNSPTPTPSRGGVSLKSPRSIDELTATTSIEALEKLSNYASLKSSKIVGDYIDFRDGSFLPVNMLLPLQIRVVQRVDEGEPNPTESMSPLTVGGAWLSIIAENTYESQLASLLRSRKGIEEILLDDRQILNRYLKGNLSLNGLKASRLWTGHVSESQKEAGEAELSKESDDPISVLLRRRVQLSVIEERKAILTDQQNRLRRLLARELQRQHSSKAATVQSMAVPTTEGSSAGNVSSAVSNLLKRFGTKPAVGRQVSELKDTKMTEVAETSSLSTAVIPPSAEILGLQTKLRCLQVEWYRICHKLRSCDEAEKVLERKVKRIRYVTFAFLFL
jgi:hypothetical protein